MLTRTNEMPMPGGKRQYELLEALNKPSLYELMQGIYKLGGIELSAASFFNTSSMWDTVREDSAKGRPMFIMLHTMSRNMLRSIIAGTVAYDAVRNATTWYERPESNDAQGSGVYVVGLARKGSGGRFLTVEEIEKLIEGLEDYIKGADVVKRGRRRSTQQQDLVDWVQKVDRAYHYEWDVSESNSSKFICTENDEKSMRCLIKSLNDRCRYATDKTVRQKQSPQYVGCSIGLQKRMRKYDDPKKLEGVNRAMGLTLSLCHTLGFEVEMVPRVAIRNWLPNTLSAAEQLVAILARSMVFQTGFNQTAAGGHHGEKAGLQGLAIAQQVVMQDHPWMSDNLDATTIEMDRREAMIDNYQALKRHTSELEGLCNKNTQLMEDFKVLSDSSMAKARRACHDMDRNIARVTEMRGRVAEALASRQC